MKINSYPPFVVFFDVIAAFLFFLVLNQSNGITFNIPETGKLFLNARLVYIDSATLHYFPSGDPVDVITPDVLFLTPCGGQEQCVDAISSSGNKNIQILLQIIK